MQVCMDNVVCKLAAGTKCVFVFVAVWGEREYYPNIHIQFDPSTFLEAQQGYVVYWNSHPSTKTLSAKSHEVEQASDAIKRPRYMSQKKYCWLCVFKHWTVPMPLQYLKMGKQTLANASCCNSTCNDWSGGVWCRNIQLVIYNLKTTRGFAKRVILCLFDFDFDLLKDNPCSLSPAAPCMLRTGMGEMMIWCDPKVSFAKLLFMNMHFINWVKLNRTVINWTINWSW